jgi:hypothetical protein
MMSVVDLMWERRGLGRAQWVAPAEGIQGGLGEERSGRGGEIGSL